MINYSHNKEQNSIIKAIFKLLIVILEVMHPHYWIMYLYIPVYISLVSIYDHVYTRVALILKQLKRISTSLILVTCDYLLPSISISHQ